MYIVFSKLFQISQWTDFFWPLTYTDKLPIQNSLKITSQVVDHLLTKQNFLHEYLKEARLDSYENIAAIFQKGLFTYSVQCGTRGFVLSLHSSTE